LHLESIALKSHRYNPASRFPWGRWNRCFHTSCQRYLEACSGCLGAGVSV
jgi:hypothetical protein